MSLFSAKKIQDPGQRSEDNLATALSVDMFRQGDKLIILAPIGGIDIKNLDIVISDDVLTITGHRHQEEAVSKQNYFSQECFWGEFKRSIVLPVPVDTDEVAAFYKKGTLRIELPITEEEQSRVIPIQLGGE
ncbi:MAG: Hsp20/alpha crystallin family protein, partial [bacterium]|nr:Hsp20/alpha crystallin family protein [bacterium]